MTTAMGYEVRGQGHKGPEGTIEVTRGPMFVGAIVASIIRSVQKGQMQLEAQLLPPA